MVMDFSRKRTFSSSSSSSYSLVPAVRSTPIKTFSKQYRKPVPVNPQGLDFTGDGDGDGSSHSSHLSERIMQTAKIIRERWAAAQSLEETKTTSDPIKDSSSYDSLFDQEDSGKVMTEEVEPYSDCKKEEEEEEEDNRTYFYNIVGKSSVQKQQTDDTRLENYDLSPQPSPSLSSEPMRIEVLAKESSTEAYAKPTVANVEKSKISDKPMKCKISMKSFLNDTKESDSKNEIVIDELPQLKDSNTNDNNDILANEPKDKIEFKLPPVNILKKVPTKNGSIRKCFQRHTLSIRKEGSLVEELAVAHANESVILTNKESGGTRIRQSSSILDMGKSARCNEEVNYLLDSLKNTESSLSVKRSCILELYQISKKAPRFGFNMRISDTLEDLYVNLVLAAEDDKFCNCVLGHFLWTLADEHQNLLILIQIKGFYQHILSWIRLEGNLSFAVAESEGSMFRRCSMDIAGSIAKYMDDKACLSYVGMKVLSLILRDRSCYLQLMDAVRGSGSKGRKDLQERSLCVPEITRCLRSWDYEDHSSSPGLPYLLDCLDYCLGKRGDLDHCADDSLVELDDTDLLAKLLEILCHCMQSSREADFQDSTIMRKWNTVLKIYINMSVTCFGTDVLGSLPGFLAAVTESLCIAEKKQDNETHHEMTDGAERKNGYYDVIMHTLGLLINLTENDKINCLRVSDLDVPIRLDAIERINFLEYLVQVFVRHICSSMQTTEHNATCAYFALLLGCIAAQGPELSNRIKALMPDKSIDCIVVMLEEFLQFQRFVFGPDGASSVNQSIQHVIGKLSQ